MASSKLDIVIRAQDQASRTLADLSKRTDQLQTSVNGLSKSNNGASVSATGMTAAFFKAGLALEAVMAAANLAGRAIGTVVNLGKDALKSAAAYEQSAIAFETMLGSADKAKTLLKDISRFAAQTPFELPELIDTTKRLLAYNIAAEDIIPTLTALGNVTAGIGREKLPQLILAYGQVRAATRLTGMELRQFTEAGVPLIETLARQFGVTEARILEMVSAGEIGFPAVQQAFKDMSGEGGKFFNLMERQSKTYDGVISNLRDNFMAMGREIIGISQDGTIREGSIFHTLTNKARELLGWVDQNKEKIKEYGVVLMDRLVYVLQNHVMPLVDEFGRKFLDYITSDQFRRDLQDASNLIAGIASIMGTMANHAERTKNAINGFNALQNYTPAGLIGSGIRKLFGFAEGGYTGSGPADEIAGVVHRGEYVVPKHQVDQTTGRPKASAGGFSIQSLTINNYTPTDQQAMLADLGWAIARRIA